MFSRLFSTALVLLVAFGPQAGSAMRACLTVLGPTSQNEEEQAPVQEEERGESEAKAAVEQRRHQTRLASGRLHHACGHGSQICSTAQGERVAPLVFTRHTFERLNGLGAPLRC